MTCEQIKYKYSVTNMNIYFFLMMLNNQIKEHNIYTEYKNLFIKKYNIKGIILNMFLIFKEIR